MEKQSSYNNKKKKKKKKKKTSEEEEEEKEEEKQKKTMKACLQPQPRGTCLGRALSPWVAEELVREMDRDRLLLFPNSQWK